MVVKTTERKLYDYGTGVIHGALCKECGKDNNCTDKGCPVYKWRKP